MIPDHWTPSYPEPVVAEKLIRERQPAYFSYADWLHLDAREVARGRAMGRPRIKFTRVEEMLTVLRERRS